MGNIAARVLTGRKGEGEKGVREKAEQIKTLAHLKLFLVSDGCATIRLTLESH